MFAKFVPFLRGQRRVEVLGHERLRLNRDVSLLEREWLSHLLRDLEIALEEHREQRARKNVLRHPIQLVVVSRDVVGDEWPDRLPKIFAARDLLGACSDERFDRITREPPIPHPLATLCDEGVHLEC